MPNEPTNKDVFTEDKIKQYEEEAEQLIKDNYHPEEGEGDGDKEHGDGGDDNGGNDTDDGDTKGGNEEDDGDNKADTKKDEVDDGGESDDDDPTEELTIEELKEQLVKAQKQVKDNKGEFTRRSQELSEVNKRNEHLEQNIFDLKNDIEDLKNKLNNQKVTTETTKETKQDAEDIVQKLKAINDVDPEIANAITPVIKELVGQVNSLKTELKVSTETATKTAKELAEDAHFGKIDKAHPGWEDMMRTDEFKGYLQGLSPRQRNHALADLKDGSAEDVIEVFSDFKSTQSTEDNTDVNKNEAKRKKLEEASKIANPKFNKSKETNVKTRKFKFTKSEIAKMSPAEFAKHEKDIDAAMAAGEIDLAN
jgi:hypothetical protein